MQSTIPMLLNQLCLELSQISSVTTNVNMRVNQEMMATHLTMHQSQ